MNIKQTPTYQKWYSNLRDDQIKAIIGKRLVRLAKGNPGDAKPVCEGLLK